MSKLMKGVASQLVADFLGHKMLTFQLWWSDMYVCICIEISRYTCIYTKRLKPTNSAAIITVISRLGSRTSPSRKDLQPWL